VLARLSEATSAGEEAGHLGECSAKGTLPAWGRPPIVGGAA
jgi:hypothetical protein